LGNRIKRDNANMSNYKISAKEIPRKPKVSDPRLSRSVYSVPKMYVKTKVDGFIPLMTCLFIRATGNN